MSNKYLKIGKIISLTLTFLGTIGMTIVTSKETNNILTKLVNEHFDNV